MVCGASWSWIVRKSCIWSPPAKYRATWRVLPPAPEMRGLGAHPGVVPAEGDGGQGDRRIAVADGLLVADLPRRVGQLVDAEVADPRRLAGADLEHGHDEHSVAGGRREALDDRDLAVGAGVDDESGEHRRAVAGDLVGDDDRLGRRRCPAGTRTTIGATNAVFSSANTSGAAQPMTSGRSGRSATTQPDAILDRSWSPSPA